MTPTLLTRTISPVLPIFRRESISWRSLADGIVQISVEVRNESLEFTDEGSLVVEAAPFGAFVPNIPVARIAIGALDPGERRTVSTFVPRSLLDRVGSHRGSDRAAAIRQAFDSFMDPAVNNHWIGNLNVYFDRQPDKSVERHCAFGLRVPAGSRVGAFFIVMAHGSWTVETTCSEEGWKTDVLTPHDSFGVLSVYTPSESGRHAFVTANVVRDRDRECVPVEFEFETVDGWGDTLGCVKV